MQPDNKKTFVEKIKGSFWIVALLLSAAVVLVATSFLFFDDINIKLNKTMTCTVTGTKVVSETYSLGNSNGSSTSVVVETENCPEIYFRKMPDGIQGTNDLQRKLKPGHKYKFVYLYIKLPMDTTKVYSFTEAWASEGRPPLLLHADRDTFFKVLSIF